MTDLCVSIPPLHRRRQSTINKDQLEALKRVFAFQKYPPAEDRERLARETGLSERVIMDWFKQRRMQATRTCRNFQITV